MASIIHQLLGKNYCLVCSAVVSPTKNVTLNKLEALFLFKILLEVPQDSQLINQVESALSLLPVCDPCGNAIKQCKQMYTQISAQIEQLLKFQTELLKKIQSDVHHKPNQFNSLVNQCRHHVKNHNYEGRFGYPFAFHDLSKLFGSHQEYQLNSEECFIKTECNSVSGGIVQTDEPFVYAYHPESLGTPSSADPLDTPSPNSIEISETFLSKQELDFENEDENDKDNKIDTYKNNQDKYDQDELSEEDDNQQLDFKWNPVTGRFHCLFPSCPKTHVLKKHILIHFEKEHSKTYQSPRKTKKTPSLKCGKCEKSFSYKSGLLSHQKSKSCRSNPQQETISVSNCFGQIPPKPTSKRKHVVKNTKTGKYHCEHPPCSMSFLNRVEIKQHLTLHQNRQDKNVQPNRDYTAFENRIVQKSILPQNSLLPLQQLVSTVVPSTITSNGPSYVVQNTESLNYSQYDPNGEIPSSSRSSSLSASYPATPEEMTKQQEELKDEDFNISEHSSDEESSSDSDYQPKRQKLKSSVQINNSHIRTKAQKTMQSTQGWDGVGRNPNFIKYDLEPNPITGKYPCLDLSCSKSSKSVKYIRRHYEQDHLKVRKKESFSCGWPGCGKIIGDKKTYQFHMDKHRGKPQNECEICGAKFYWSRGLIRHKIKVHGEKRRKY